MPRRPCSICLRPDLEMLHDRVKHGDSARNVALSVGIHPRVFTQHLRRHASHPIARRRAGANGAAALKAAVAAFSVQAEARALLDRVSRVLDAAEKANSHALTLSAVREAKGLLDLVGRTTGELATPGQTTVNVALGVSVEQAKSAVEVVELAQTLTASEVADRAESVLRMYNAENPQDARWLVQNDRRDDPPGGSG